MKAQFFLFNIEGYGEFFSGITPFRQKARNLFLMVKTQIGFEPSQHFTCVLTITTKIYQEKQVGL
jgi:hypothetical protein